MANKILKARTDHKSTGQDELDLRNGILSGQVVYQERYIQTSRYLYERFLDGSFDPQRLHAFNKPISPSLLEDFLSAAAYSNPSIWAEGRPLLEHDGVQVVRIMELSSSQGLGLL